MGAVDGRDGERLVVAFIGWLRAQNGSGHGSIHTVGVTEANRVGMMMKRQLNDASAYVSY